MNHLPLSSSLLSPSLSLSLFLLSPSDCSYSPPIILHPLISHSFTPLKVLSFKASGIMERFRINVSESSSRGLRRERLLLLFSPQCDAISIHCQRSLLQERMNFSPLRVSSLFLPLSPSFSFSLSLFFFLFLLLLLSPSLRVSLYSFLYRSELPLNVGWSLIEQSNPDKLYHKMTEWREGEKERDLDVSKTHAMVKRGETLVAAVDRFLLPILSLLQIFIFFSILALLLSRIEPSWSDSRKKMSWL